MANEPISISLDDYNNLRDGWALAIGHFMFAFTSCEYWTYLYIRTFGSERLREAVGDFGLGARAELAHALVSDLMLNTRVQARVDDAFKKLGQLASTRNLVAHNGPMVHLHRDEATGEAKVVHELRSARNPSKDITIAELGEKYLEAAALDEELAMLYGLVRQPESRKS